MSESGVPNTILVIDVHSDFGSSMITIVTKSEFLTLVMKDAQAVEVLKAIHAGVNLNDVLKTLTEAGSTPGKLLLTDVTEINVPANSTVISLRGLNEQGNIQAASAMVSNVQARNQMYAAIKQVLGDLDETYKPGSIWDAGITQLVISGFALLFCVPLTIVGFFSSKEVDTDKLARSRSKALF